MFELEHPSLEPIESMISAQYDSAYRAGFDGMKLAGVSPDDIWHTDAHRIFKAVCFPDFKKAQITIGWKVLELEEQIRSLNDKEKKLRSKRETQEANEIKNIRVVIENRQLIFRRLLDSMLWTLVWPQKWILRRYRIEGGKRKIDIKTIEPLLKEIEKRNDDSLDLICDPTTIAQLGDLIIFKWDAKRNVVNSIIAELKVGPKNVFLCDLLKDTDEKDLDGVLSKLTNTDPQLAKQAKRILRQEDRLKNFENIVFKDEGVHPLTGTKLRFFDSIASHDYRDEIHNLVSKAKIEGSHGLSLDKCLNLFATTADDQNDPHRQLKLGCMFYHMNTGKFCGPEKSDIEYLLKMPKIINLFEQCMMTPIAMPPFVWYPKEIIMDLITKRVKIFAQFNYERFFNIASDLGIKMCFITGKEAHQIEEAGASKPLFEYRDKRFVKYENSNGTSLVSGARLFSRVYMELVRPYSKLINIVSSLEFVEKDQRMKKPSSG
jgi:hypothetical protein